MIQISKIFVILQSFVLLVGCVEGPTELVDGLVIQRKYALRDCLVQLDLLWSDQVNSATRGIVAQKIGEVVKDAISSGEFPAFSAHTTGKQSYYVFYYTDRCEERWALTEKLVKDFLQPKVDGFPDYTIIAEGIEPGFDGVTPSGGWVDY